MNINFSNKRIYRLFKVLGFIFFQLLYLSHNSFAQYTCGQGTTNISCCNDSAFNPFSSYADDSSCDNDCDKLILPFGNYSVPIQIWRNDNNIDQSLTNDLVNVNQLFQNANISFYEIGTRLQLPASPAGSDYLNGFQCQSCPINDLAQIAETPNVINLYIVNQIETCSDVNLGGAATLPCDDNKLVIEQDEIGTLTLAHEFGHIFGLFHTFQSDISFQSSGTICDENDRIGDTPFDPQISQTNFLCMNSPCDYSSSIVCNATFGTNEEEMEELLQNIMSYYSLNECRNKFTPCQYRKMNDVLLSCRSTLCGTQNLADYVPVPILESIISETCVGNENIVEFSALDANFSWYRYDNETGKRLELKKPNSASFNPIVDGDVDINVPGVYYFLLQDNRKSYNPDCGYPVVFIVESINEPECSTTNCTVNENCIAANVSCNNNNTYDIDVTFGANAPFPSQGFTIFATYPDGSPYQTIPNAIPNQINTIANVPIDQCLNVWARETEFEYCPGDIQTVCFFPEFNPIPLSASCGTSNVFVVSYSIGTGTTSSYIVTDQFGYSETLSQMDLEFSNSYTSGTIVELTISDPNNSGCSLTETVTFDCGNPPPNLCDGVAITNIGQPDCDNMTFPITINGDPTVTYEVQEKLNGVSNAAVAFVLGGNTVDVPYNIDGTGLVSFEVRYQGQVGANCDEELGISISQCNTTGTVGCGDNNGVFSLYWPFPEQSQFSGYTCGNNNAGSCNIQGACGTMNYVVTRGENCGFHGGSDFYAQDWGQAGNICNDNFYSPMDGEVIYVKDDCPVSCGGGPNCTPSVTPYGNQVIIKSLDGNFAFRVSHLNAVSVIDGQTVSAGQLLGTVGNTGNSFGAHAHTSLYQNINDLHGGIPFVSKLENGSGPGVSSGAAANSFAADFEYDCTNSIEVLSGNTSGQCFSPSSSIDISFKEEGTIQNVIIEFCDAGGSCVAATGGNPFVIDNSLNQNTWVLNTTTPNTPGIYTIKIYDQNDVSVIDESNSTIEVSNDCGNVANSCSAPNALNATSNANGTSVDFIWSAVNGATGYIIEAKLSTSTTWSRYSSIFEGTSFTSSSASCTGYDVRIAAVCPDGNLTAFTATSFVTNGCNGPSGTGGGGSTSSAGFVGDCPGDNDDDEDPVFINCPPQNYVFGIDNATQCMAYVNWSVPVAVDNCNVSISQVSGPSPGTLVGIGVYTVVYLAEDNNGNTETCDFTVVVEDTQELEFHNCPTVYSFNLEPDECTAYVNWSAPVATDNCDVTVTQVSGPTSGSQLSEGVYQVVYLATNTGNPQETTTCSFIVEVIDNQPIEFINCPTTPLVFGTDPDQCDVYANWSIPVATDNCNVTITHISGPQVGDQLAPGTYTVVYMASNNDTPQETATCSFQVIVNETQNPELNCPQDITVDNDNGVCEAVVNNIQLEFAFDNCPYEVTWTSTPTDVTSTGTSSTDDASGAIFPVGITTVTYTITEVDDFGNGISVATCDLIVTVLDSENPIITCPADATIGTSMGGVGDCEGEYTWTHPTPTDNCEVSIYNITFTNPDNSVEGPTNTLGMEGNSITRIFDLGLTTILYHVEDPAGNITECSFTVLVEDDEDPMIFCEDVIICNNYVSTDLKDIIPSDVTTSVIHVANDQGITDLKVLNLQGIHPSMGELTMTLTSPTGTVVTLYNNVCTGEVDFDLSLDDAATSGVGSAPCSPLGQGGVFQPISPLSTFDGESSQGDWILTMTNNFGGACGVLNNWELEICGQKVTGANNKLSFVADAGICTFDMNDTIIDPPFSDNCPGAFITHDYINGPFNHTLQGATFPVGVTSVTWTVTDQAGNTSSCILDIEVLDTEAPEFLNCPRPDIIENAETSLCGAYVNFSPPIAEDNCGNVTVVQTDNTGLNTGSVFPVGKTILEWTATDAAGNSTVCTLNVIVNDTQAPSIACPADLTVDNDTWMCGAVVNNIAPIGFSDNCSDNISISYQIEYPVGSGNFVKNGMTDASGFKFEVGTSQVTYQIADQPLLLISEVTQELEALNGGTSPVPSFFNTITTDDYIEVTNFGNASIDISCLNVERIGVAPNEFVSIPAGTMIAPGEVLTVHFGNGTDDPSNLYFNVPCAIDVSSSQGVGYVISYAGVVIDVVTTNGFDPIGQSALAVVSPADWSGAIANSSNHGSVYRATVFDSNTGDDFLIADVCAPATLGGLNPELEVATDNGATTALQTISPNTETCSFLITVNDVEMPYCGEFQDRLYSNGTNLGVSNSVTGGTVYQSVISVNENFTVGNVDIFNLIGQHDEMSDLTFKLKSPSGTQIILWSPLCAGTSDFDVNLDNDSLVASISTALCSPLGGGELFTPEESLKAFYGENSQGDWILEIADTVATNDGQLNSWELRLSEIQAYSQMDSTIFNEPNLCSAEFSWIHPRLIDNCCAGTIEVEYIPVASEMQVPQGGIVEGGTNITERFDVGVTTVKYTLIDAAGNINTCSFDITVLDIEDPVVMCPADIIIHLDPGACEIAVSYEVTATDNCEVDTIIQIDNSGLTSGDFFPIGSTIQSWVAIDTSGNTDTCSFDIVVNEFVPQSNDMTCNSFVHVSLDETCEAEIKADMILEGNNYGCYDDYTISISDALGNILPTSPIVSQLNIGDTLIATILDPDTGLSCWGYLIVEDKLKPEFDCPADVAIKCNESYLPENTGEPTLLSCENNVTITYEDNFVDNGNCGTPRAEIFRSWIVTDDSGNADTCVQNIIIERFSIVDVLFPTNLDDIAAPALECASVTSNSSLTHPSNTGFPTIDGHPITTGTLCPLSIEFNDNVYNVCGGSYDIIRTWEIYDPCEPSVFGQNPLFFNQTIKVLDNVAPIITCQDFTISSHSNSCVTNIVLPAIQIEDACSGYSVIMEGPLGDTIHGNGGLFPGIFDLGNYTFNYSVKDDCGNIASCDLNVTVIDDILPTAICDQYTVASLDDNGISVIDANTFDDGSFDNCEIVLMEVRKMNDACNFAGNLSFGSSISFCCEEIGTTVMVEYRVTDASGLQNSCMIEVEVQDKIAPVVICPPSKTILCIEDPYDLTLTGEGSATDNCSGVMISHSDISNTIDDCGEGTITRLWTATDAGGETSSCIQIITLENNNPFTITDTECRTAPIGVTHSLGDNVEYPCDVTLMTCGQGLSPDDLASNPSVNPLDARPQLIGSPCENVAITHQDQILEFGAGDACLKILRKWMIIDWCQADANQDPTQPGIGVWHFVQVIKVVNSSEPSILAINGAETIENYEENCTGKEVIFDLDVEDDCTTLGDLEIEWEFSDGQNGTGEIASGTFSNGNYTVTYMVSDQCGNEVVQSKNFEVIDAKKPTPVCLLGISTVVMPSSGSITLAVTDFESGSSYDNCTPYHDLKFSFSADTTDKNLTITCLDYAANNGLVPVTMYATDEAGNYDFCTTFVQIQDPNTACPSLANLINGVVENEEQEKIEEVTVSLNSNNSPITSPIITGSNGYFQFNMPYGNYDVVPEKDINYLNGVTTYDLVLIAKHILGIELLDSPYKIIAADANHSESVTTLDIVKLRALILHIDDELANNSSWRFVDKNYTFPNPTNPFEEVFPEFISLNGTSTVPTNFVAIKIGDLNGTASPNSLLGIDTRIFDGELKILIEDNSVSEGQIFTIDFKSQDFVGIEGYQFTMNFDSDKINFVDVSTNLEDLSEENFGLTKLEEGIITTSWNSNKGVTLKNNTTLFSLTFEAKTNSNLEDIFKINSRYTEAEAYTNSDLLDVTLGIGKMENTMDFDLFQNVPNPFKETTTIGFVVPKSTFATLDIFDISGKVVQQYELNATKGYNKIEIEKNDLLGKGVFYYQLKTTEFSATKKMILID